ncbi:MAG: GGDEF domain-containing protein [Sulfuricella sp.]|nr:GGDEF domain-containing protein [Sulfuricella sp.]
MTLVANELTHTDLLRGIPDEILMQLRAHAEPRELAVGEILLAPDQDNRHVYLLLSGTLAVHFETPDSPPIRELAEGASVGEISIIDGTFPSAYVIAKEQSRVFPIHRDLILRLIGENNPVVRNLLQMMTRWMKTNTERIIKDRLQIWELTDHANVDRLTGLFNRRWLDNAFGRLLIQAGQCEQPLSVLLLDVDNFKKYNDGNGHLAGDQALVAVGKVLKTSLRPYDFATRYGGEEFLILLPNTNRELAMAVAQRVRQATEQMEISSSDGSLLPGITVSIGQATNADASTPAALIQLADTQLYRAKHDGRNCVR